MKEAFMMGQTTKIMLCPTQQKGSTAGSKLLQTREVIYLPNWVFGFRSWQQWYISVVTSKTVHGTDLKVICMFSWMNGRMGIVSLWTITRSSSTLCQYVSSKPYSRAVLMRTMHAYIYSHVAMLSPPHCWSWVCSWTIEFRSMDDGNMFVSVRG